MSLLSKGILPLDSTIPMEAYCPIDLSEKNQDLQLFDTTLAYEWEVYMEQYLLQNQARVAFGGYLEKRNLYDRSEHFEANVSNQKRNIHLGIDFWCKANTSILAFMDGKIHSHGNNSNYGDYGPTLIVEHQLDGQKFYSLYGHLSLDSITDKFAGQIVRKGDVIGSLGTSNVNGDYAPHLHFQIIRDMFDYRGDYPGVCSLESLDFYRENCPNPLDYISEKMPEAT